MIGEKLTPILVEIESTLWDFEAELSLKPDYPIEALRASIKIFMSVMMDKMWEVQEFDNMEMEDREKMVVNLASDLMKMVKTYTGVNTLELYNESV